MKVINPRFPPELPEDRRNVINFYKYWSVEAIKSSLDSRRTDLVVIAENFCYDFNISTLIRNCNAFIAKEVYIVGRRKWDRRGAAGTQNYETIHYTATIEEVVPSLRERGYSIFAIDNLPEAESVTEFSFPKLSAVILGQESIGVSQEALEASDGLLYVPQYGSTRSINVGCASAIIMYEYMRQHGTKISPLPSET